MSGTIPPRPSTAPPSLSQELDDAFGDENADGLSPATAFLVGLSGKYAGKLFRIREGDSLLGRTSRALVTLDEKAVSHQHAQLTLSPKGCFLSDLGSTNGTFLNDARIVEPQELRAGDVIRVGNSTLGYLTDAEDEGQHTRALARVTRASIGVGAGTMSVGGALARVSSGEVIVADSAPRSLAPSSPDSSGLDTALDYFDIGVSLIRRYRGVLLGTSVLFALVGAGSTYVMPPKAIAKFEILLRQQQTQTATQHFATRSIDYFMSAEKNFFNQDLVAETMEGMKLDSSPKKVADTASDLSFEKAGESTFRGTYSHPDAAFAEQFLSSHLKSFLEHEIGKSIQVLASEVALLRKQYDSTDQLLKEHEGALRDFKNEHLTALPDMALEELRSKSTLVARRDELSAAAVRYQGELVLSRAQLNSEDALITSKVAKSEPYEAGLAEIDREIAAHRARGFSDEHPDLKKLLGERAALDRLREQTVSSKTTDTELRSNPEQKRLATRVAELQVAVDATGTELGAINQRLSEIAKIAEAMPEVEAQVSGKLREVAHSKSLHDQLYEQLRAKELELQFERASVEARYEVMGAPRALPVGMKRTIALRGAIGGAVGAVLGAFLAIFFWLREYATNRRAALSH